MARRRRRPTGDLAADISSTFGSFDASRKKLKAAGVGRFGSGWVWLIVNKSGKLEVASTPPGRRFWYFR